eukprot:TRINITY_DN3711_c0_g1_i1.p1 TRINITY_DN3711_c0_g1~~TRINITY_DN3711_c0_g1_i1.p1  ORF type:complete len:112 (+),score=40.98 TRINITY_DN3711_c0_g1_i1:122-457(+)
MFAIRAARCAAASAQRRHTLQQTRGLKGNVWVEEFAGMRETTEKRFGFDPLTIRRALTACALVPALIYYMVAKDSAAWSLGVKGHTAGRRGIDMAGPKLAADDAAAEEEEE